MHELAVTRDILDIVCRNVPVEVRPLVQTIRIRVGDEAGIVTDSLQLCFSALLPETDFPAAHLIVEHTPFTVRCATCHESFHVQNGSVLCPKCGGIETTVLSGTELQVVDIELNDQSPGVT